MRWRFVTLIIFLLGGWCKAGAQELPLTHFTSDSEVNALPSALVTHIYQDKMGYMWFAVYTSGLVRYDGSKMEIYNEKHGLGDLSVWQIAEDREGHLWVSSDGGVVVSEKPLREYRNGQKAKFTSVFEGIPLSRDALKSQQLTVDKTGRVWIGTKDQGILRYHIDKKGVFTVDTLSTAVTGKEMLDVKSLRATHGGSVLAGLEGGYITEFKEKRYNTFYGTKAGAQEGNFSSLYEDREKGIWAYRSNGEILHFRSKFETPEIIFAGLPAGGTSITAIKDGTILAGNLESGITRIDPGTGEIINSYSRSNGLLTNNVYHIFEDREGNIWIGQSGGVSKLRYNFDAFENFTARSIAGTKAVLPTGRINTVLITPDKSPCRFWAGTEGGGATCVDQYGSSKYITQADGLAGDWVNGLSMDEQGRIWIATTQGLNAIVFDKDLIIEEASNVREITILGHEGFVFSLWDSPGFVASEKLRLQDEENDTYVESNWFAGRGLFIFAAGKIYELGLQHGLPYTIYKSVAMDEQGYLWVGTEDRGLYRSSIKMDLEKLKNTAVSDEVIFEQVWSRDKGAPTNNIEKLLLHRSKLWVGTQLGLFALDPATGRVVNSVTQKNGLPADNAVSFALSPVTGHLWVGTNGGLAEVDPEDGKVFNVVTRQDGLVDNEVWLFGSVKVDTAGNVFYGTSKGLSIYHPEKDRPNTVAPKLQLTSAEISYKSDSRNEVTVEYTALSFANVGEVTYRTRLLGYDNTWSQPSAVKRLRYTNLPAYLLPKTYTLEVTAENESGIEAVEPLRYEFEVEPVWWLRWWALLLYITVFGIIIIAVDRIQRRRLIKRERDNARIREAELQAETANARSGAAEAKAKALKAENEKKALELEKVRELKKAYNELKTTQNQLIQTEKMASLGRLATGVAHEIKNPLNFINNFAELSVELVKELEEARKSGNEEEISFLMSDLRQNTTKIGEHGKRADAIVKSMMQHARGGKPVFENFDINELVEKYTELAYRGKRDQFSKGMVTIKKDLDPDIGEIKIVGQEVGQVLLNVLGNSLDAVFSKKETSKDNYEPVVEITTRKTDDFVEIIISDNGPGVPGEIQEKIFEPFFTTKPTGEGTGLGLSLSYNIITQGHNGSLRLINKDGEGAMFVITLPILQDHPKNKVMV